ncbi:uncharacterized protein KIAA1614 homolog [Bombina bombina]|uniref:uncharacterized protein KIAA1614 homolog n=1 Tax=Bombina bombina TaxID=8345 RepID=UPI00235B1F55|nr:uncharacterized protein KIAA1614 homolog [Bombina bombina]
MAKMSAEDDMGESPSHKDNEKKQTKGRNKTVRRTNTRQCNDNEGAGLSGEELCKKTSVLQGKVKALKEKHKAARGSEVNREEGGVNEDALVTPQVRTYLTEEALQVSKQEGHLGTVQENLGSDGFQETCTIQETAIPPISRCESMDLYGYTVQPMYKENTDRIANWMQPSDQRQERVPSAPQSVSDLSLETSLSLAERVEKNRQELSWKFNKASCERGDSLLGEVLHCDPLDTSKDGSWLLPRDIDGDSGVSLPDSDGCKELSVRHDQAKQLLQRARMKARGTSPLRASHCVLQHSHSKHTLRRGPCTSGAVTDGGSLSDSSSSDHCSCHRTSSRGSSPSHVRFQDESEQEAELRYRERKQQGPQTPCVSTTPPLKRHSSHALRSQPLSGHNPYGTCGPYINGSGASHNVGVVSQVTNSRNIQFGPRIPQDSPLSSSGGLRPSPHWILPSQPWRIQTELIRETHIGGDSTADSSGEEEGSHGQRKPCHAWVTQNISRNNLPNTALQSGTFTYASNSDQESESRANLSTLKLENGSRISQKNSILEQNAKNKLSISKTDHMIKISHSNKETHNEVKEHQKRTLKTGTRAVSQEKESRTIENHVAPTLEPTQNTRTSIKDIGFNIESRTGTNTHLTGNGKPQTSSPNACTAKKGSSLTPEPAHGCFTLSGHVPAPPAGRASNSVPSRTSRYAMRPERTSQQLPNSDLEKADTVQILQDKYVTKSDSLLKSEKRNKESVDHSGDGQHLPGNKCKDQRTREKSYRSRKQLDKEQHNDVTDHRNQERTDRTREQLYTERSHSSRRHRDHEKHHSTRRYQDGDSELPKRDSLTRDLSKAATEQKGSDTSVTPQLQDNYHMNAEHDVCTSEVSVLCHPPSQSAQTKDSGLVQSPQQNQGPCVVNHSPLNPPSKKGNIRSGVQKLFSTFGLTPRPRLERCQSSSMEQISSASQDRETSGNGSCDGSINPGKIKKSPSLQSLKLMSPFHLPRKSSSVQNLVGKQDRSPVYVTADANTAPRRALSVEDIGSPGMPRALGRVAEVYADGTRLLEMQRPTQGSFGLRISSVNGRADSGVYVQEMSDESTAKLYSGLLRVGDEVLEVNGTKVSFLRPAQLNEILDRETILSLRVLHQRRSKC